MLVTGNNDCLNLVLSNGKRFTLDIQLNASGTGDSVLHVLYGHSLDVSEKMYTTTRLLEAGGFAMEELIKSRDTIGNTPLHVLARYVGVTDPQWRNNSNNTRQRNNNEQVILEFLNSPVVFSKSEIPFILILTLGRHYKLLCKDNSLRKVAFYIW